jgi:catechol 2,3-dioxygenase-like lactoylglutathione lyase family enzyme
MLGMSSVMIRIVKLHHVSFAIRDLEASRRFFGTVLGLPEIERPAFSFPGAWYALADRQLHLIQKADPGQETAGRISRADHVAVEVADLEDVKKRLDGAGVSYTEGGNRSLGMDQLFCQDPDGHVLEFVRYINVPASGSA